MSEPFNVRYAAETIPVFAHWFCSWQISVQRLAFSSPELTRLYEHASQVLGGVYLPEAVLVVPDSGPPTVALCYISQTLKPAPASNEYIDRIVTPAQWYGFPAGYIEHLESFRP